MNKKIWEKQYPEMPEVFRLAVEQAVKRSVEINEGAGGQGMEVQRTDEKIEIPRYKHKKKKWRLLVLAAVLCGGVISALAVAGRKSVSNGYVDFQGKLGLGQRTDLNAVWQEDIEVRMTDEPEYIKELPGEILDKMQKLEAERPLISIDRIMYDGLQLAVCAYPAKELENYDIESWSMTVNGQKIRPNEMDDNMGKQDYFIFTAQLYDMKPADYLEITLPLSVYGGNKRYENQELRFSLEGRSTVRQISDQNFVFDNYTVKLTEMRKSLTALFGKIKIERTPEQENLYEKEDRRIIDMVLEGVDGSRWEELPLREYIKTLAQDEKHEEGYFYYEIPKDGQSQVKLQLMSQRKNEKGEKWDVTDPENEYGDPLVIDLQ